MTARVLASPGHLDGTVATPRWRAAALVACVVIAGCRGGGSDGADATGSSTSASKPASTSTTRADGPDGATSSTTRPECPSIEARARSLGAGVRTTASGAQREADHLLEQDPPESVTASIGVLVAVADGASGAELALDVQAARQDLAAWVASIC